MNNSYNVYALLDPTTTSFTVDGITFPYTPSGNLYWVTRGRLRSFCRVMGIGYDGLEASFKHFRVNRELRPVKRFNGNRSAGWICIDVHDYLSDNPMDEGLIRSLEMDNQQPSLISALVNKLFDKYPVYKHKNALRDYPEARAKLKKTLLEKSKRGEHQCQILAKQGKHPRQLHGRELTLKAWETRRKNREGSTTTETSQSKKAEEGSKVSYKRSVAEKGGILYHFDVQDGDMVCSSGKPEAVGLNPTS